MGSESFVSVRGEAVVEAEPEIAVVFVTVMARDKDRRRAVHLLAQRSAQVADTIKGYGDSVEKLESRPVVVNPEFKEGKPRERIAGYVATGGFSVTIGDVGIAGELVALLAGEEMVAVAGPDWLLRPDSPVYRQARLAAARDAMQRARDYAQAFGGEVTSLADVADTGLLTEPRERGLPGRGRGVLAARALAAAPAELDLEPARQVVRAQVEARFTMAPPTLPPADP